MTPIINNFEEIDVDMGHKFGTIHNKDELARERLM